jgi:transcriptional regulator with XRE-family HTH domain
MAKKTKPKTEKVFAKALGLRIRHLRRQKKITLLELSDKTKVAQATLSRIETGRMLGTIESHQKIARELGISLSTLYDELDSPEGDVAFLRESDKKAVLHRTRDAKLELLTRDAAKKKMSPLLITLPPRAATSSETLERGIEKFMFVLEGNVLAKLKQEEYVLGLGDTLYFDASLPHFLSNPSSEKPTKLLCIVSPPNI